MPAWTLDRNVLDDLTKPGPRLPGLTRWLIEDVWTLARYQALGQKPSAYLLEGESMIHRRETVLTLAGDSIYGELAAPPPQERTIRGFLHRHPDGAVVILDGCSIREMPRLMELAQASGRAILESGCSRAAVPSETEQFIADRTGLSLPIIAPNDLPGRRELRDQGIRAYWFRQPTEKQTVEQTDKALLLWMRFPDMRFMDTHASSPELFDSIWDMLQTVWMRTVQGMPNSKPVLITSDHGYVFLGQGLSEPRLQGVDKPLDGKRFKFFEPHEPLPEKRPGLWVDQARRLAVLAGRAHNRPQAPSPSQSLYRHGGLSVMEMLTPWLVLGPKE